MRWVVGSIHYQDKLPWSHKDLQTLNTFQSRATDWVSQNQTMCIQPASTHSVWHTHWLLSCCSHGPSYNSGTLTLVLRKCLWASPWPMMGDWPPLSHLVLLPCWYVENHHHFPRFLCPLCFCCCISQLTDMMRPFHHGHMTCRSLCLILTSYPGILSSDKQGLMRAKGSCKWQRSFGSFHVVQGWLTRPGVWI